MDWFLYVRDLRHDRVKRLRFVEWIISVYATKLEEFIILLCM